MDSGSLRMDFGVFGGGFWPFSGSRRSFGMIPGPQGSPGAVWGGSGGPGVQNYQKPLKIIKKSSQSLENLGKSSRSVWNP